MLRDTDCVVTTIIAGTSCWCYLECNVMSAYSNKHDAYFDWETKVWDEEVCGDPACGFCQDRPETAEGVEDDTNKTLPRGEKE